MISNEASNLSTTMSAVVENASCSVPSDVFDGASFLGSYAPSGSFELNYLLSTNSYAVHVSVASTAIIIACVVVSLGWRSLQTKLQKWRKLQVTAKERAAMERKQSFLQRHRSSYGYPHSPKGFIDDWRLKEFPSLIAPHSGTSDNRNEESEVYLDYAGAALATRSQLQAMSENQILANPHSTGPAAARTSLLIEQTTQSVLEFLNATPGRSAHLKSAQNRPDMHNQHTNNDDYHPGYDVIFTSGTSEALRIVAERFRWASQKHFRHDGTAQNVSSTFLYSQNSHTSVVGMRGCAMAAGGKFKCVQLDQIADTIKKINDGLVDSPHNTPNLAIVPLECNFGSGERPGMQAIHTALRSSRSTTSQNEKRQWALMLDIAKAASTSPIHLRRLDPDFACLSFYKIFGSPTGLGALLVKRGTCTARFLDLESSDHRYYGGGSVDMILSNQSYTIPRSTSNMLSSLTSGTCHYRGIVALRHGFQQVTNLGGMHKVQQHTLSLATEFALRLKNLKHASGRPAVKIYGKWDTAAPSNLKVEDFLKAPGSIVTLNILRDDGTFIGYNEVAKLAGLQNPPIQFRTGCFCNTGACQQALEWTDDELIGNHEESGHVCGDHIDVLHGRPTGAIRISFGKDSIWEDMDAFWTFLKQHFVSTAKAATLLCVDASHSILPTQQEAIISQLYIFPIKSCAPQRVLRWKLSDTGGKLQYDREFALIDSSGTAMRLQKYPRMALICPSVDLEDETLHLSAPGMNDTHINLRADDTHAQINEVADEVVTVCGNKCGGKVWGSLETSHWFSQFLGVPCWLARYQNGAYRPHPDEMINPPSTRSQHIGFANEQPILLLTESAVSILNGVLAQHDQQPVEPKQFRPNVVIKRAEHQDDDGCCPEELWEKIELTGSSQTYEVVGECARCAMVDYDPITGEKGKTLRALSKYRRRNGQITFGLFLKGSSNVDHQTDVWIHEGDMMRCFSGKP